MNNRIISLLILCLTWFSTIDAQTPYDDFYLQGAKKKMLKLKDDPQSFKLYNIDSTESVEYVALDMEQMTLSYYNHSDSLLASVELEPDDFKWWSLDPLTHEMPAWSPYSAFFCNPIRYTDPLGLAPDDVVSKQDGSIEVTKTDDKFDRFFVENKNGENEFVGQFDKNSNNLVQLPSSFSFTGSDGTSLGWTSHTDDSRRNISGEAAWALIGALYQTGTTDLSVGQFSLSDGSSAPPKYLS